MTAVRGRVSTTVATVVDLGERGPLDAAAVGNFWAVHADSVLAAMRVVRERPVHAVLISPRAVGPAQIPEVAELVRGFPGVPAVAVVSRHDSQVSERLLAFGACGVRRMVDLSAREGWRRLRELLADPATPFAARMLAEVIPALGDTTLSCRRFFELVVRESPRVVTVRALARIVEAPPSTLMSRFFRAGVPSPKRYLAMARLVHAAGHLGNEANSVSDVAYQLGYSSPQSFGRHIRNMLGVTSAEFRRRYPFEIAVAEFVARLIVPYGARYRTFHPLPTGVSDLD
jgi:AraC-like DNA-binding protein